jgi:hypothetical protein
MRIGRRCFVSNLAWATSEILARRGARASTGGGGTVSADLAARASTVHAVPGAAGAWSAAEEASKFLCAGGTTLWQPRRSRARRRCPLLPPPMARAPGPARAPPAGWQDLKDKFREVGNVVYANVSRGDDGEDAVAPLGRAVGTHGCARLAPEGARPPPKDLLRSRQLDADPKTAPPLQAAPRAGASWSLRPLMRWAGGGLALGPQGAVLARRPPRRAVFRSAAGRHPAPPDPQTARLRRPHPNPPLHPYRTDSTPPRPRPAPPRPSPP